MGLDDGKRDGFSFKHEMSMDQETYFGNILF